MMNNKANKLDDIKEVNEYYDKILNKIQNDFNNKDYISGLERLKEELDQPYIPLKYENIFKDLLNVYIIEYKESLSKIDFNKLSCYEIYDKILNQKNGKINFYLLNLYLEYQKNLTEQDFNFLAHLFSHPYLYNEIKYDLFNLLKEFDINHEFKYLNNNLKQEFSINPKIDKLIIDNDFFKQGVDFFEKNTPKDQTSLNYKKDLLYLFFIYFFPNFNFEDINVFLNGINDYINFVNKNQEINKKDPIFEFIEFLIMDHENKEFNSCEW